MKASLISAALLVTFPALIAAKNYKSNLWPIPQSVSWGEYDLELDTNFHMIGPDQHELTRAMQRYSTILVKEHWKPVQAPFREKASKPQDEDSAKQLKTLMIQVDQLDTPLDMETDESYTLTIPLKTTAHLKAATVWGAIRGLETFSQLIQHQSQSKIKDVDNQIANEDNDLYDVFNDDVTKPKRETSLQQLVIPKVPIHIQDAPTYPHRGLMLDTSRNYYSVNDILRTINAMSFNKLNVFHWHITDSHSFPLKLDSLPDLANKGAYRFQGQRLVYTKKDVQRIVQYARDRGIRVIPEIDMPAHTGSWALAYKDITTCFGKYYLDKDNKWENRLAAEPGTGQLNPVKAKTYEIVGQVIKEIAEMFPDSYYHGGGDEPVYKCWDQNTSLKEHMKSNNVTHDDLLHQFLDKELDMISKAGKHPILWEDAVTNNDLPISKDVVLQIWTNPAQLAIKKGYKVIASNSNFWYLDCGHGGWAGNDTSYNEQVPPAAPAAVQKLLDKYDVASNYAPSNWGGAGGDWCSPFKSWQRVYSYDLTFNLTKEETKSVLGGEVALWSEQSDPAALDIRLWPRSAAAAEVLWSGGKDADGKTRDIGDAMPRMFDWRYRLVHRGINADPIQPLWCGQNPHLCDATYPAVFLH
ncbi:glycoside hydrolase superfamily [Halteromyces radiatus]|uniref:glycoside hydrolase superfamily n=1 Tax=Halteromyces radiatus TaxID=101107 RepID=UPI0022212206|nr:glycoside hydrolase superfamily [Halteromyces radiatus]KAI8080001.1 glycoside hydrolase superfamily [Halteromyces radiatus]